jgi:hypothetical protein
MQCWRCAISMLCANSVRECGLAHTHGVGREVVCFSGLWVRGVPMSDDDEIQFYGTKRFSHFGMDDAFCLRMREAIAAGLENAPIGVNTTPGTNNPKLAGRYGALLPQLPSSLDD